MPAVAKSVPSTSTSAHSASDALTNLTRAATIAFTAVQEQAQAEIAQARAERDDAIKALHEAQLDAKDLELREEGWRAALEKSDLTIKHQAETIEQLRNEVDQWKTQLMRLEESSRQEIDDWKEQYRRAEQERSRLSSRIDDLVAGQLAWNTAAHAYSTPYTPRVAYMEIPEASTSASGPKRATTATQPRRTGGTPHGRVRNDSDEAPPPTARKNKAATSHSISHADRVPTPRSRGNSPIRSTAGRRKDQVSVEVPRGSGGRPPPRTPMARPSPAQRESQARTEPRQQIIRRVTAVVDVKEEETEDGFGDHESVRSGSVYEPDDDAPSVPPSRRRRRASNASVRRKQVVQDWDEDEQTPDVGEEDEYEEEPEEEDDELLLAPKANKSLAAAAKQARGGGAGKPSGAAKGLKRKIDAETSAVSGRAGPTKAAKTRRD
ncbi:hypothetical protein BV20DRAFT_962290 [Pilatotrama ljubarskyi]|nr:hypothetical protein BV20DRAFT_962290 [Pilatotrama ljubarskyi]